MKIKYIVGLFVLIIILLFMVACTVSVDDSPADPSSEEERVLHETDSSDVSYEELAAQYNDAIVAAATAEFTNEAELIEIGRTLMDMYGRLEAMGLAPVNGEEIESAEVFIRTIVGTYITKSWETEYTDEVIAQYAASDMTGEDFSGMLTKDLIARQKRDGAAYCIQIGIPFLEPMEWPYYTYVSLIETHIDVLAIDFAWKRFQNAEPDTQLPKKISYTGRLIYQIGDGAYYHLELSSPVEYNGQNHSILLLPTIDENDRTWTAYAGAEITVTSSTSAYEDYHGMLCLDSPEITTPNASAPEMVIPNTEEIPESMFYGISLSESQKERFAKLETIGEIVSGYAISDATATLDLTQYRIGNASCFAIMNDVPLFFIRLDLYDTSINATQGSYWVFLLNVITNEAKCIARILCPEGTHLEEFYSPVQVAAEILRLDKEYSLEFQSRDFYYRASAEHNFEPRFVAY